MTLADQIRTDVNTVFLNTDDFAENVVQYHGGWAGVSRNITALVTLEEPDVTRERGKGYRRRGEMMVADETLITDKDAFLIGAERYEVERMGIVREGIRIAHIIRYAGEYRGNRTAGDI